MSLVLKHGIWMLQNNSLLYTSIFIPVDSTPEIYSGSLNSIFSYADISVNSLMFANINHEFCMCTNHDYFNDQENVNLLATSIYRDYLHLHTLTEVVYGPVLLFGYKIDQIKNQEILTSIHDKYIEELFQRFTYYKF